jgi:3-hydroxyisobutyrate dehydrogenase-like beta-hydroxyacid dehydrogenase
MQKIGFIGVGKIGTEIVKHLLAAGYEVIGHRRTSLAEFQKIGGTPAASASEVGEQADIVFSCLPGGDALDEVVDGPHGLVHTARAGQIVVELGSHPLPAKERQIKRLAPKGAIFLDGEVSGTPGMVALRKAPIYLAGDAEACQKIEPIVKTFTELCLYLGSFGTAGKIKFVNNLLVVVNTAAIGEAVALALNAGVDYIDDLARTTKTSTPLFWLAADLFRRGIEHGLAKHDVSAIIEVVHQISSEQKKRRKSKQSD